MMLTPEQLANLHQAAKGGWKVELDGRGISEIVAHIDAQQARIAELEEKHLAERHAYLQERDKCEQLAARIAELEKDAARYRHLRRGQHWSVIDGIGDALRAGDLDAAIDAAIDAAMQPTWPEDASDYGSRIAVIGQNGATGEHYDEEGNK